MQLPFRTDIWGEVNTDNDRTIYSKQYPYAMSVSLESRFHQILMKESDIEKTAFSINNGKFEFLRMLFSVSEACLFFAMIDHWLKLFSQNQNYA